MTIIKTYQESGTEGKLLQNGKNALFSAKQSVVASMAKRFVPVFLEGPLVELFQAEWADKVLGVELPEHGGDATTVDGFAAPGARGPLHLVVRDLVRHLVFQVREPEPFVFEKATSLLIII